MHNEKCAMYNPYLWPNRLNFLVLKEIGSRDTNMTSGLRAEVEIWPFGACAMHPAIIIETVRCGLGYGADTTFHRTYF